MDDEYVVKKENKIMMIVEKFVRATIILVLFVIVIVAPIYLLMDHHKFCHEHFSMKDKYDLIRNGDGDVIDTDFLRKYHHDSLKCDSGVMTNGVFYETIERRTKLDVEIIMNNSKNNRK